MGIDFARGKFMYTKEKMRLYQANRRSFLRASGKCIQCQRPAIGFCLACKANRRDYFKRIRYSNKDTVFLHYGNKCNCCGETSKEFLTVDHVNNDGTKFRRNYGLEGSSFYAWIVKNNYPTDLQLLCMNCNWGKRWIGTCPHLTLKKGLV